MKFDVTIYMILFLLFILSFLLTYFTKNYAIKKSLIDIPNDRSSHTIPTPHGGGIAIAITWFVGLSYLDINKLIDTNLFYALMIGVIISFISFFDDLYDLSPKIRLVTQSLVAIGGLYILGGLDVIDFGLFTIKNPIFTNLLAFFMIVWFINLYNFLDGINGYAGSEAVFLGIAGYLLFGGNHFLVLVVSVLGFLYWNWNKAKIFMGDVGSTLLGYNVAIFTIYYANQNSENFWKWLILFALFWFDATLTLYRRWENKEKLSQAHKKHAYQRLTQARWSHLKVSTYAIVINILIFCLVYFISNIYIDFLVTIILLYVTIKLVDLKKQF